ncbi:MAG TPA: hypothetical protein VNU44_01845 [Bryobacteraceae bacterium]|jgi:hypothetical protein|nr:hypothetical protein [Bryobacteraceae bacterium]
MKTLLIFALLPIAAHAQLAIYAINGPTETVVGSSYTFGQVALNTTYSVQFQIYNTGKTAVTVNTVTLIGPGFAFEYPPVTPYVLPPGSTAADNIWVSFTPTAALSCSVNCSANLTVSTASGAVAVILVGTGVVAPTLSSVSGCSTTAPFNFGSAQTGNPATCTFALLNSNPQPVTVESMIINGLGFTGPYGVTAPLTIPQNYSVSFSVTFTPPGATVYTGTLVISVQTTAQSPLTQTYSLSGTGQPALLPTPALQFDAGVFASQQQRVLTMSIPGGSPIAATGTVKITFVPTTPAVTGDSAIVFLANNKNVIPFSVSAGATQVQLNGQGSATFQTGTTEGTITFTVATAAAMTGDPTTKLAILGTPVIVDSTSASKERAGFLDITIVGADNTYTAGAMAFSFFDASGNAIGNAVSSDFTSTFKTYYGGAAAGSAFQVLVSFPVVGSVANIGSVKVTLTNAAGVVNTGSLTFQ